jgi:hypothetical protein
VNVDWGLLRSLASFRSREGVAVSLFLDLDPADTPVPSTAASRFRALRDGLHRELDRLELGHDQRAALRADLARLDEWWATGLERDGARGYALFASSLDGLWREVPVPAAVGDDGRLGPELYIGPLVEPAGDDHEGALVAVVSRERGRILRLGAGRLEELAVRVEERIPALHGGRRRPAYDDHIASLVHRHLKAVAAEIDRYVRASERPELVLVTQAELRGELEALLAAGTRRAVAGWVEADDDTPPAALLEVVRPVLAEAWRRRLAENLERWQAELARKGRATAGLHDTLEAASEGRVDLLLLQRGFPDDDPHELAIRATLVAGGTVAVTESEALAARDGVGALLRY